MLGRMNSSEQQTPTSGETVDPRYAPDVTEMAVTVDGITVTWVRDGGEAAGGTLRGNDRLVAGIELYYLDSAPRPIVLPDNTTYRLSPARDLPADVAACMAAAGAGRARLDEGAWQALGAAMYPAGTPDDDGDEWDDGDDE